MFFKRHDRDHGRRFGHEESGHRHGRFGGGRHWRGGGGRRVGRIFEHGDLRFVILPLIAEKPRYGYEIIKAIEDRLGGAYSPSPGVVYPTLTMLEELGYATVMPSEGGKKLYTITPEGSAFLEANRASVDAVTARIDEVSAAYGSGPAQAILRSMENLKLALHLRLGRGPLSEEQVRAIADAIDAAAIAVERS